ncbi:hypothetical protein GOP47_0017680 [Adiantum capillus-veneris]|uniref:Uncharacterized protein n=1 Tax=Adiantum capillus-veneris TaxID=13818 RepID=A0A9D4UGB0_ADICA|nr:hypothetical protein GOP47_0017680 [Adiantum capillus-veneris]
MHTRRKFYDTSLCATWHSECLKDDEMLTFPCHDVKFALKPSSVEPASTLQWWAGGSKLVPAQLSDLSQGCILLFHREREQLGRILSSYLGFPSKCTVVNALSCNRNPSSPSQNIAYIAKFRDGRNHKCLHFRRFPQAQIWIGFVAEQPQAAMRMGLPIGT